MMRLGIVDYINMLPVVYGLEKNKVKFDGKIIRDVPTNLNSSLSQGIIDVGFISSIEYARGDYNLLPYCISSKKTVMSVVLVSKVPFEEIKSIQLSTEAATSVILLKILMRYAYKQKVSYGKNGDAELLIGDQALKKLIKKPKHVLDLGKAWNTFSNKNMVFGVLASRKNLPQKKIETLLDSIHLSYQWGQDNLNEIIDYAAEKTNLDKKIISQYFAGLSYSIGIKEISSLKEFYTYSKKINAITEIPCLDIYK
ncbi:menaquinone biosynthetic enzyme MqnA/MqnD family protein [Nitrosopumilus maritimus]|uniref:Chorismate dehydratase n=1 Tax=Nitrosopumilus maritimus (strain SCM1) TaxID=436308 RepID=A9A207_NITMS|nr:menaquinone biosynthesis protein [Nitrosopumilus maritimus]ABX12420.1 protein of unknown function DUF178 [Nitrosopumilus maritimus SCM1]